MTDQDIEKCITCTYSIDMPIEDSIIDIEDYIDDEIFSYERNFNVDIDFFLGNASCYPYITCKSSSKKDCIDCIKHMIRYLMSYNIKTQM